METLSNISQIHQMLANASNQSEVEAIRQTRHSFMTLLGNFYNSHLSMCRVEDAKGMRTLKAEMERLASAGMDPREAMRTTYAPILDFISIIMLIVGNEAHVQLPVATSTQPPLNYYQQQRQG